MIWVSLAIALVQLVAKMPEIVALLERIFGKWKKMRPMQIMREAEKLLPAVEEKLAQHGLGLVGKKCPIQAYAADLDARYS